MAADATAPAGCSWCWPGQQWLALLAALTPYGWPTTAACQLMPSLLPGCAGDRVFALLSLDTNFGGYGEPLAVAHPACSSSAAGDHIGAEWRARAGGKQQLALAMVVYQCSLTARWLGELLTLRGRCQLLRLTLPLCLLCPPCLRSQQGARARARPGPHPRGPLL